MCVEKFVELFLTEFLRDIIEVMQFEPMLKVLNESPDYYSKEESLKQVNKLFMYRLEFT